MKVSFWVFFLGLTILLAAIFAEVSTYQYQVNKLADFQFYPLEDPWYTPVSQMTAEARPQNSLTNMYEKTVPFERLAEVNLAQQIPGGAFWILAVPLIMAMIYPFFAQSTLTDQTTATRWDTGSPAYYQRVRKPKNKKPIKTP